MNRIAILKNPVMEYAWGSTTAIAELLGARSPSPKPQAELWMGAHPRAPSMVRIEGEWRSLLGWIDEDPDSILGNEIALRFGGKLPYLFKILAADKPLSIQAHPSRMQAVEGFNKENALGIPMDSPQRNYRDDNPKPEIICALTGFWVMCGFRRVLDMISLLERVCRDALGGEIEGLRRQPDSRGLKRFFRDLMTLDRDRRARVVEQAAANARECSRGDQAFEWVLRLSEAYPTDMGVLFPLLMNVVCLRPGDALFLPPGELHAYLHGVGLELMANSDNVLRGGLTPKHVDVPELLRVLNFRETELEIVHPQGKGDGESVYVTPAEEFVLSVISLEGDLAYTSQARGSVEVILCTEGEATVTEAVQDDSIALVKGTSIIIPAAVKAYRVQGNATVYKAGVPL